MNLDPTTLAVGAAVGGGVGTLAALVLWALLARFVYRSFRELDSIRDRILEAQATELELLEGRVLELEREKRRLEHDRAADDGGPSPGDRGRGRASGADSGAGDRDE